MDRRALASRAEVAAFLGVPTQTLALWAHQEKGPKYKKIGRFAKYDWKDVDTWLTSQPSYGGSAA